MTDFTPSEELKLEAEQYLNALIERTKKYQFKTFIIGVKNSLHSPDENAYLKRTIGLGLFHHWNEERDVDFRRAQLQITCQGFNDEGIPQFAIRPRAVYLYGRYRKLERNISQTRWVQKKLKKLSGNKIKRVTSRFYEESIQELLSKPIQEAFQTSNLPTFHGMGREDADVLMLGEGRPFVLEVLKPKMRFIDLEPVQKAINDQNKGKIEVLNLRYTHYKAPAHMKGLTPDKTYRALCRTAEPIQDVTLIQQLPETLNNITIEQRTPQRVSARRADMVRPRTVRHCTTKLIDETSFELELRTQSGTYIKELISSDEGRTTPSVAELIKQACVCEQLDVLDINVSDDEAFANLPDLVD